MKSKKMMFKCFLLLMFCLHSVFAAAQRPSVELTVTQPSPNLNIRLLYDKYNLIAGQEYTIIVENLSNKNMHVKGQLVAVLVCGNEVSTKFDEVLKPSEKMGGHAYLFDASGMTGIVTSEDCQNFETVLDDKGNKERNRIRTLQLRSYSSVIEKTDEEKSEEQRQRQLTVERKQQEEASKQAAADQQIKMQHDAQIQQQNAYNQRQQQLQAQMQVIQQKQQAEQQKYDAISNAVHDATNEIVDYLKKKQAENEQKLLQQQAEQEQQRLQAEMDRLQKEKEDEDRKQKEVLGITTGLDKKGYEILININGLSDSTVYLSYHLGDKQYVKDSVKIDKQGYGDFSGLEPLPKGIYMIVLPGRKYFEMLISDDQIFSVSCSYSDYFRTLKFSDSDENTAFIDYQKKWIQMQEEAIRINTRLQNNKSNSDSSRILSAQRINQEDKMKKYLNEVISTNKGSLLSLLVTAMLPLEIPQIVLPPNTQNPDSVKWVRSYLYNKNHFFDNIDFTDERLLRTPILQGKLNVFFTNVVIQQADSINKEIDNVIKKCSGNYKIYQFVAVYLFNHFRESEVMGHDAVMVKLADDIYLSGKADWTTKEWRDNLRKEVDRIRPNLIGVKGHDLIMDTYGGNSVTLYDINKDFTILYFWEPGCGHCQEVTSKLKAYYAKAKNEGIEVFAICTQSDKPIWEKYIRDNNLTWINGWDPKKLTNFDYYYNVQSTPIVYVLDRKKVIIAKKLPIEDIGPFIENWRKFNDTLEKPAPMTVLRRN